jgi:two-component system response regulator
MHSKTILLVEDNASDVALIQRSLDKSRISNPMVVATDGQAALDYLFGTGEYVGRDGNEAPTLILLDLKLPKVDGLTVLQRVRSDARTRRTPVVILTSSTQEEDLAMGYDRGVNSYLRKPVHFDQFVIAMGQVGIYWLLLNEAPPKVRLAVGAESSLSVPAPGIVA